MKPEGGNTGFIMYVHGGAGRQCRLHKSPSCLPAGALHPPPNSQDGYPFRRVRPGVMLIEDTDLSRQLWGEAFLTKHLAAVLAVVLGHEKAKSFATPWCAAGLKRVLGSLPDHRAADITPRRAGTTRGAVPGWEPGR